MNPQDLGKLLYALCLLSTFGGLGAFSVLLFFFSRWRYIVSESMQARDSWGPVMGVSALLFICATVAILIFLSSSEDYWIRLASLLKELT